SDRYEQAGTYHQLGNVAYQLRQYEQAKDYYQQALDIYIEYGDLYEQAHTYGQLGMLAEELSEFKQAKSYYLQALEIFVEFEDQQYRDLVIRKLASLYQKTQDNSLLTKVATMFEMTEAKVKELFESIEE
ncbi:MAG: tetratricopeptide repeat protein, partial [Cyanobacteria bacterium P01_F01_bin.143]